MPHISITEMKAKNLQNCRYTVYYQVFNRKIGRKIAYLAFACGAQRGIGKIGTEVA